MSKNFAIFFGGTGARCAEAVAYLAASGALRQELHLLVVDPDESNGNVHRALSQLRRYHDVQQRVTPSGKEGERPFFSTRLNTGLNSDSFFWANPNPTVEFKSLINYAALGNDARALLDLLYDEDDLSLTFEKGYIGRAHLGSLDLLRTLEDRIKTAQVEGALPRPDSMLLFFRALREATQQPAGARLMVVGSVFGGTGASGLPAVPPLLRRALPEGLEKRLSIACVQVAPYFSFPPGGPEDPDSALHPLATQAALYHYSLTDIGYNRIYLVGAPGREQANEENVVGGDAQRNRSHYVELAAALALAHYFDLALTAGDKTEVMACGAEEVKWDALPFQKETSLRRRLVAFGTFCMMHSGFLAQELLDRRHLGAKWMDDLRSRDGRDLSGNEPELKALREFAQRFLDWGRELQRVDGVDLFSIAGGPSDEALASIAPRSSRPKGYHAIYRGLSRSTAVSQEHGTGWYVEALTRASSEFCEDNYK